MTRFGVMKHLRVLEEAGLVTTRRRGREKLHFLNPVPIRLIHDRWVSKYAEPWAATLSGLKTHLEDDTDGNAQDRLVGRGHRAGGRRHRRVRGLHQDHAGAPLGGDHRSRAAQRSTASASRPSSDWTPGSEYTASVPGVVDIAAGKNLEVDPPRLLVQTFDALWSDAVKAQGTTRVTWEIAPVGDSCRLTVTHDQLPADANAELYGGWPMILSGLKTLLETGELLDTPGSLMYSQQGDETA